MIKNRMPLTKLLLIALLVIVFFAACLGFGASMEMRYNYEAQIFVMIFAALSVLLLITSFGIWRRQNWARIFLIFIFSIMILGWTGVLWYWYQAMWSELGRWQRYLPGLFSIFIYSILLGGIFFLNNSKVKDEFDKKLSQ